MKTECSRGPGGFQGVTGSIRAVQFIECLIQAAVIFHVRLSYQGGNRLEGGEYCCLFSLGMPDQDFVEEPEAFYGGIETFLSLCRVQRCGKKVCSIRSSGLYSFILLSHYFWSGEVATAAVLAGTFAMSDGIETVVHVVHHSLIQYLYGEC